MDDADADDRIFVLPSNEENNCPSCRPTCVLDTVIGGCAPSSSFTNGKLADYFTPPIASL